MASMERGRAAWPTTDERTSSARLYIIKFGNSQHREIRKSPLLTSYLDHVSRLEGTNAGGGLVENRIPGTSFSQGAGEESTTNTRFVSRIVADTFLPHRRFLELTTTVLGGLAGASPDILPPERVTAYANRIEYLRADGEIDGVEINPSSEGDFWKFISIVPEWGQASLILVDDGSLRAVWRRQGGDRINVEFLGNGMVEVAIFEGGHIPDEYERFTVIEAIKSIQQQGMVPV